MRTTNVVEAWIEQRTATGDGLRSVGPTLFFGNEPVACWLDRADETGAQIALRAVRVGRSYLKCDIDAAVNEIHGMILDVPCPLPTPSPTQHEQNIGYLVTAWQNTITKAARSTRYAWGKYKTAQREAEEARLYAWAFDLPTPHPIFPRGLLTRARRNAIACRRAIDSEPSRDMLRSMWRGGRDVEDVLSGPVMLRLSSDNHHIETSLGEKVPADQTAAALLWTLACECRQQQQTRIWRVVSERPRIGKWTVHRVQADGSMQISCHTVCFSEIARLAVALGVH